VRSEGREKMKCPALGGDPLGRSGLICMITSVRKKGKKEKTLGFSRVRAGGRKEESLKKGKDWSCHGRSLTSVSSYERINGDQNLAAV